jgi:hypothetical protein
MVEPHRLPDWRIGISGQVAADTGEFKAGQILFFMTEIATASRGTVQFPMPSPARLALSVAVRSARSARDRLAHAEFLRHPGRKTLANDPDTLGWQCPGRC